MQIRKFKILQIKNKYIKYLFCFLLFIFISVQVPVVYAALSCSVTTVGACTGTVLLRMSGSDNAHAELPSQSTSAYDGNVVCCSGVVGLGNSCSGNYKTFAKLSGVTNAHVERSTQSNYANNACISSTYAGDVITTGYQTTNCSGYDTTLFSMASTPTNSHVGSPSSYTNKVCAKVVTQTISFSLSASSAGFGNLTSSGLRYATSDGVGSASQTESYNISVATNADYGYGLYVQGDTLKKSSSTITAIGGTNTTPSPGTKAFGIRAVASGGSGSVVSPYDGAGFAFDATPSSASNVASASTGDSVTTTYSIRTVATIDTLLDPGLYNTSLTYVVVANF